MMWPGRYKLRANGWLPRDDPSSLSRLATPDEISLMLNGGLFPVTLGPNEEIKHSIGPRIPKGDVIYFGSKASEVVKGKPKVPADVAHRNRSEAQRRRWHYGRKKSKSSRGWTMSPAGREKISAAQKARWDKVRAEKASIADFYAGA